MAGVDDIIKQWVAQVEATGEIRTIAGFGQPIDLNDGYDETPEPWRMALKVLKNADYAPVEVGYFARREQIRQRLVEPALGAAQADALRAELQALDVKIALAKERFGRG